MHRDKKLSRLRQLLKQIAPNHDTESLAQRPAGFESTAASTPNEALDSAFSGLQKISREAPDEQFQDTEIHALEAIILPRERPVVFIQNGVFGTLPSPWSHFADNTIRGRITPAIPAVGRVELPDNPRIPYGGTGFVVGPNLLMTNRHVAELFANGLGTTNLAFRPGQSAALNFRREKGDAEDDQRFATRVSRVVLIHPFWDMAILRVDGLPDGTSPLSLSITTPDELSGREVAVIGFPARDDRNDLELQDRIFERTYDVKRLQPGKIRVRERIRSFGNLVNAVTHDSSTLGGNSGSAIIDVTSGEIVGLHFAGIYLKANFAVPTSELARDRRVVDAGVNFTRSVAHTDDWAAAWRFADRREAQNSVGAAARNSSIAGSTATSAAVDGRCATWTIPLRVSVELGIPSLAGAVDVFRPTPTGLGQIEAMRIPVIHGGLESRMGYDPAFLELPDNQEIPLPELTTAGKSAVVKLDDGSTELRYHKFSVVMHKQRRLALFTAANIDWRSSSRLIDGRKPTRKELTGLGDNDREQWITDPRIPEHSQLPDLFFTRDGGAFDKGHLVRRDDVCWGFSFDEMQKSNGDTYHTTNCSPQVSSFNQSARGEDNWGDLENLIQKQTKAEKAIVFAGPVLDADDPVFVGREKRGEVRIQIPTRFWKIVIVEGETGPSAFGFTLEQDLAAVPTEFVVPSEWQRYMRRISDIEELLSGLASLNGLEEFDQFDSDEGRGISEGIARA